MGWWVLAAAAIVSAAPPTTPPPTPPSTVPAPSTSPADPLGCDAVVFDPAGELDRVPVEDAAARAAAALGADVRVRAEGALDTGLDQRMAQLEAQCPAWTSGGERAGDLVVVMYSSAEREASVFYGADQGGALESRWEDAVDVMTERLRVADYTEAVTRALLELRLAGQDPDFTSPFTSDDGASGGVPPIIWLGLIVLVVGAVARAVRYARTGGSDTGEDDGSGWSGRSSRRSWGSWSRSRSSGRRSFSSRRSSSTSSRRRGRSGGGTKRW